MTHKLMTTVLFFFALAAITAAGFLWLYTGNTEVTGGVAVFGLLTVAVLYTFGDG